MTRLRSLEFLPLQVQLREPFGIATGAHHVVDNVLVRLVLEDGTEGLGEAAPVPHISGESPLEVLARRDETASTLTKLDLSRYRDVSRKLSEVLGDLPSARAGVEIALIDALTRRAHISLWQFFGGASSELVTDITVPTGDMLHAKSSAERAHQLGFREIKIKVGGGNPKLDRERVLAIAKAAPEATLILDGNTAFSAAGAIELFRELEGVGKRVVLFEQPVAADDFDGLCEVEAKTGVPVAADESLRSVADLRRLVRTGGVSAVNIKTAKFGLVEAWDLLISARSLGFEVMVGGMVETELSMTASACLAAGVGGVRFVDLDTPLFLANSPMLGGFEQQGPHLRLEQIVAGHGVTLRSH